MSPSDASDRPQVLHLEHEGCDKCTVAVRATRGSGRVMIYDRRTGVSLLSLKVVSDKGSWLADALAQATEHARSGR